MVAGGQVFVQVGRAASFFATRTEAIATAKSTIAGLSERDFAETVTMTWDVCDVYGVLVLGAGWYLKLAIP